MRLLLSKLYESVVRIRALLYGRAILPSRSLRNPVISVGNLTVGGTGKTPYVAFLAELLKKTGYQPIILSRGYGGKAEKSTLVVTDGRKLFCGPNDCGDEPYLLARKLEGVPVVVGRNRFRGGRAIEDQYERVVHILDDGFQHLKLKRNLDVLLLDGTDPFGGNRLLPAGRLREPPRALQRADLVVITRSHLTLDHDLIELQIRKWHKRVPISYFHHDAVALFDLKSSKSFRLRDFVNRPVLALAAIGNPGVFLRDLSHYQLKVVERFLFRDHHIYTQPELDRVLQRLSQTAAAAVITTEKDSVRLEKLHFGKGQILVLQIEAKPEDPEQYRNSILDEIENLPKPH
ncbi:MAG: tetraacyldisaccharide 4'-kinase [Acidobacteriota bacterium]